MADPVEKEIAARGPQGPLGGVLTLCGARDAPLAIIHPGSGPTDRDGNNPLGLRAGSYRLLARELALRGIDIARIDKRGMFSSLPAGDANAVTLDDYADDLRAWVEALDPKGERRIALIGHSEGGLSILAAAARGVRAGALVLLCAPGRPTGDLLRAQLAANPANAFLMPQALAAIETLERAGRLDPSPLHPALAPLFAAPVQGFVVDLMRRDPAAMIAAVTTPTLIVEGGRDIQVGPQDGARLAKARPDAERVILDSMTHALKDVNADDRLANLATYARPDLPLSPALAGLVADFIQRRAA